jgi:hypothetical protein
MSMSEARKTVNNNSMQARIIGWQRRLYVLASGGVALGLINAWTTVDFGQIFANFLSRLFSVLVALLLGGQVNTL